jgi:hypothetical protein
MQFSLPQHIKEAVQISWGYYTKYLIKGENSMNFIMSWAILAGCNITA